MNQNFLTGFKIAEIDTAGPSLETYRVGPEAKSEGRILFVMGAIVQTFTPDFDQMHNLDEPLDGVLNLKEGWNMQNHRDLAVALEPLLDFSRISTLFSNIGQRVVEQWGDNSKRGMGKRINEGTSPTSVEMVRAALQQTFDSMRVGDFDWDLFRVVDRYGFESVDVKSLRLLRASVDRLYFANPDEFRQSHIANVVWYLLKKYYSLMDEEEKRRLAKIADGS